MKQGIFEYVNLKKQELTSKEGKPYSRYVVVSDVQGETYKVYEKLKKLGFEFNRYEKYWFVYPNKLTREMLEGLKQINAELKAEGGQTENLDDFVAKLDALKEQIQDSNMPQPVKVNLDTMIDQYIEDIANATDVRAADAEIQNFIEFSHKFHNYSFNNQALIYLQDRKATKVAGKRKWETEFKRRVIDEKKAIWIWCKNDMYINPKTGNYGSYSLEQRKKDEAYKAAVKAGTEPYDKAKMDAIDARKTIVKVKFEPCVVYDIANTEGEPVPAEPQWKGTSDDRADAIALFNIAKKSIEEDGIRVTQDSAFGGEGGWSRGGQINISAGSVGSVAASTTFHEWAHELLHQKAGKFYDKFSKYMEGLAEKGQLTFANMKQIKEVQVETVSAVMCKYYGLPTEYHPTYMALWEKQGGLKSKDLIKNNISTIREVSNYMIKKIDANRGEFDKAKAQMQQQAQQQPEA
jgi:hypothetical protein